MTTIKASCPTCGDVELTPPQVRLVVCTVAEWSFYAFGCPRCVEEVRKHATDDVVRLLTTGGVPAERWSVPAEALEEHTGPSIGWDDVLDFTLALETADVVAAATTAALRPRRVG
ncbi:hypothetical protein [Quadrisphaera sp. KR29]|uniref:hypothetical protein n=1 Tax=Quadrisphaera sp. KR29 TaxID=3461391 RepID=UPI0040450536